jgi:3-deoxy-D-manno-octulosonic-acid transferase
VIFETEIWPYYLRLFDGPVWFANARLSHRSHRGYRRIRAALRPIWGNVRKVFAQSEGDGERFADLGIPSDRIEVAGQVKQFQQAPKPAPESRKRWRARLGIEADDALWVAGSVRSDEVAVVLRMWQSAGAHGTSGRLVLAPRHLNRVDATLAAARQYDSDAVCVSSLNGDGGPSPARLFVLDTHGELAQLYAAADLALLGGTFAPHGGHNPNEPARFGVPVITGPYTANIEADLPLLSAAGLCYRLANVSDFSRLVEGLESGSAEAACARLARLLSTRLKPATLLADHIEAEFG